LLSASPLNTESLEAKGNPMRIRLDQMSALAAGVALATGAAAQQTPIDEEIIVTSTRLSQDTLLSPLPVTSVGIEDIQLGRQQLGLDESLSRVPGVFFQNRYNFAQDLRISIRGFGARSAFGIRGIRVFIDDIPSTTPDGQSGVDDLDLGSIGRIEVIRGPASALYGQAAGGVISIYTEDGPEDPYLSTRLNVGEFGSQRHAVKTGGQVGRLNYTASISTTDVEGFRGHSATENNIVNTKFRYSFDEDFDVTLVAATSNSPYAQDPGGLNAAEVEADRSQGRDRNIQFDAGESVSRQRVGVVLRKGFGDSELKVRAYGVQRDFDGRIPNAGTVAESNGGDILFSRDYYGGGAEYTRDGFLFGRPNRFIVGVDIASQEDDRQRFVNDDGDRGDLTLDQLELVDSLGFFAQTEFSATDRLLLTLGARYEQVDYEVDDRFFLNDTGDDSGEISFDQVTPLAGFVYTATDWANVYGNVSTGFETPTTTEFANPDGGGFNQNLEPQQATNYEIGIKGVFNNRLRYDLALFRIDVEDELIPFQQDERNFFENAGESTRQGLELSVNAEIAPGLTLNTAYTYSDFTFDTFETEDGDFSGNRLPGVPGHLLFTELKYRHSSGFYAIGDLLRVGEFYADNANSEAGFIDAYTVVNLRVGGRFSAGNFDVSPFVGVNNLFDEEYFANVRLNAAFNRFFEPAPGVNVFGGVELAYNFR
jgi:iron complex outermembrane receptor protein